MHKATQTAYGWSRKWPGIYTDQVNQNEIKTKNWKTCEQKKTTRNEVEDEQNKDRDGAREREKNYAQNIHRTSNVHGLNQIYNRNKAKLCPVFELSQNSWGSRSFFLSFSRSLSVFLISLPFVSSSSSSPFFFLSIGILILCSWYRLIFSGYGPDD